MSRILLAFRAFFAILFGRPLPKEIKTPAPSPKAPAPAKAPPPPPDPAHALQLLAILQRDSRLLDFLMEDIASFEDDLGSWWRNIDYRHGSNYFQRVETKS